MPAEQHYGSASKADLRSFVTIWALAQNSHAHRHSSKIWFI